MFAGPGELKEERGEYEGVETRQPVRDLHAVQEQHAVMCNPRLARRPALPTKADTEERFRCF